MYEINITKFCRKFKFEVKKSMILSHKFQACELLLRLKIKIHNSFRWRIQKKLTHKLFHIMRTKKNDEIYSISLIRNLIFKIHIFQFKLFNFHINIYVWLEVNDFEFNLFSYDRKKYVRYRCQASLFLHKRQHATSYSD